MSKLCNLLVLSLVFCLCTALAQKPAGPSIRAVGKGVEAFEKETPVTTVVKQRGFVLTQLPTTLQATKGGDFYIWKHPPEWKTTRKVNHTLIITEAPNGPATVSVTILTTRPMKGGVLDETHEEASIPVEIKIAPAP